MSYYPTPPTNSTGFMGLVQYVNTDLTGGLLGPLLLLIIFVISIRTTLIFGMRRSLLYSLFLNFVLGVILFALEIIEQEHVFILLGALLFSIGYYFMQGED